MIKYLTAPMLLLAAAIACAADLRVPLQGRDDLVLSVPDDWKYQIRSPRPELPPTISVASAQRGEFLIMITPIWPGPGKGAPDAQEIRGLVQGAASGVQPKAVERELPLREIAATDKAGYYFDATDKAPEPDGYKFLTQGAIGFKELRVTFTILVNGEPAKVRGQALEALRTMRRQARGSAT